MSSVDKIDPKDSRIKSDVSSIVAEVGTAVTQWKVGDEVQY